MQRPPPRWRLAPRDPEADAALARELRTSPTLAALLRARGAADPVAARAFLEPRLSDLEPPEKLLDVERGAERLAKAVREGERIVVYGDYDVDGMTGAALLARFFKLAGGQCDWYIPDRLKEGYSFSDEALDKLFASSHPPRVLVTVDHGTSAVAAIRRLKAAGVDVVVTDHHEPPSLLPEDAAALINPRRPGCPSACKDLCGAAVAFKLAWATAQKLSQATRVSDAFRAFLLDATAFVALATVADVVKLRDDNRVLCFHGLRAIAASPHPGLKALLRTARLEGKRLDASHVGFRLGPRLNAAGRLGMAEKAVRLLTTDDPAEADRLADELEEANEHRREIEKILQRETEELLRRDPPAVEDAICLGSPKWHPGVIGIVASRLSERWQVPVMLVALNGAAGRGSARAPSGVHLRDLLAECAEHLTSFGGHAGAAGCTVSEERWPGFRDSFRAAARKALLEKPPERTLDLDLELPFSAISAPLVEELQRLAPHGAGNPAPTFCTHGLRIAGRPTTVGPDGGHLRMMLTDGESSLRAVGFHMGKRLPEITSKGGRVSAAYRLKFDDFRDARAVELELVDVRAV
ncbi:MAG TPA: single-stranded-DNA-specific exonuclease RecJ [Planctomycetota bacterium]|nr:single-stranded-DNA-specific exonuclease RecJ [Planctomycetota bacterium]